MHGNNDNVKYTVFFFKIFLITQFCHCEDKLIRKRVDKYFRLFQVTF